MADKTILEVQKLPLPRAKSMEVGLCWRKNCIDATLNKQWTFIHIGIYYIAQLVLLLFLIMCTYRR
jgi:hypothetical protein